MLPLGQVLIVCAIFFVIMYVQKNVRGTRSSTEQPKAAAAPAHGDDVKSAASRVRCRGLAMHPVVGELPSD